MLLTSVLLLLMAGCDHSQGVLTQSEGSVTVAPGGSYKLTCACSGFGVGDYWMNWVRQAPGKGVHSQVVLTQSEGSVTVAPGGSYKLTCACSGFSVGSYNMYWVRQAPGKGLEWIIFYYTDSVKSSAQSVQGRFTASKDSSNFYLHMSQLKPEDTAVYYCARDSHYGGIHRDSCVHSYELTQPSSMVVRPDQSLTIDCKVSYSVTSEWTAWIRQPAGKALEWIGHISNEVGFTPTDKIQVNSSVLLLTIVYTKLSGYRCQTLTESEPALIQPGGSHTLTCTFSGIEVGSADISWIRQATGKGLEWVSRISAPSGSDKYYSQSVKGRFTISRENNVLCATELIQPDSVLIKPGEPLTITCTVSGASITDSSSHWGTGWIRQPAGKALEWINGIYYDGSIAAKDSLKSKFTVSRDTSRNTITLQGQNLQAEDTAVYYCARHVHGISLSSSPAQLKAPGESVKLSCEVSGYSLTDYGTGWIRQPPGKALEWIGIIWGGGSIDSGAAFKSRFQISRDTSSNVLFLEISSLQAGDTAVYYCAKTTAVQLSGSTVHKQMNICVNKSQLSSHNRL
ncbi:hypothetical protein NFI96_009669 [Prochilodus magdalenae]|nr:hypothetical protein NFI96_009669 [Prochilodus magdalenae]